MHPPALSPALSPVLVLCAPPALSLSLLCAALGVWIAQLVVHDMVVTVDSEGF